MKFITEHFNAQKTFEDGRSRYIVKSKDGSIVSKFDAIEFDMDNSANVQNIEIYEERCSLSREEIFGEMMEGYQRAVRMRLFFWEGDKTLTNQDKRYLMSIGAEFGEDIFHETFWYDKYCNLVFKLNRNRTTR